MNKLLFFGLTVFLFNCDGPFKCPPDKFSKSYLSLIDKPISSSWVYRDSLSGKIDTFELVSKNSEESDECGISRIATQILKQNFHSTLFSNRGLIEVTTIAAYGESYNAGYEYVFPQGCFLGGLKGQRSSFGAIVVGDIYDSVKIKNRLYSNVKHFYTDYITKTQDFKSFLWVDSIGFIKKTMYDTISKTKYVFELVDYKFGK